MRPLRLLLSAATSLLAVTLLFYVTLGSQQDAQYEQNSTTGKQGGFKALFSFTAPGSLFPPSAIISLTDDNSTFFLARPAAFGPTLPKDGLSSPLWIGSGFGDDAMGKGELGCGDTPEWGDSRLNFGAKPLAGSKIQDNPHQGNEDSSTAALPDDLDDGTDDHLRAPSVGPRAAHVFRKSATDRSDIKSLQESAEIEGKVVLLKRGGCGFLAKVLWAQRRGAVAVIVGDDVRGGGLIRMYAKGDTSNVTISSLFTSHTTAHLLSSLIPGGAIHGVFPGRPSIPELGQGNNDIQTEVRPNSTPSMPKTAPTSRPDKPEEHIADESPATDQHVPESLFDTLLSMFGIGGKDDDAWKAVSRRPPASGALDGVDVVADDLKPTKTKSAPFKPSTTSPLDDFTIGKQDWRDHDVLTTTTSNLHSQIWSSSAPATSKTDGVVLPGSGEYPHAGLAESDSKAFWNKWFDSRNEDPTPKARHSEGRSVKSIVDLNHKNVKTTTGKAPPHEGLWVTLTPTNVSTSPFFDTLLVLVVSPLVTLTVVYALLLLRSRIRRRRWRAPKSLVERLPVRTYQTISDSSSTATPHAASPTTPLLQHSPSQPLSPVHSRHSHSDEEEPASSSAVQAEARAREEEKRETGLAEWKRRYGGRQKECVVCLDEYVDGVSQVMSLPCGHEFHAECM